MLQNIYRQSIRSLSFDSDLGSIENILPEDCAEYNLLIIGFPIYAGASPKFFRQYLDSLAAVNKKEIFVFCTRAMLTGQAVADVYEQLIRKGY